ncbi:hypothetical protein SPI_00450 [Niveomyces insectorum RCEF 264]|uniref:DUF2461 domain containing protein n=1 Tax=Niveomyces insectorum RCEF 264 TaxID=1081102 RepID=A0A168A4Y7_9HYPO|nr:hypothetical protein SPI_00450 [Niveomyces insectorum RCEF 264]
MPPKKRQAPSSTPESLGRRRSTRLSSSGTKSRYYEDDDTTEDDSESERDVRRHAKRTKTEKTARNGGRRTAKKEEEDDSDEDVYKEEEDEDDDDEDDEDDVEVDNKDGGYGGNDDEDEDDEDDDAAPRITFTPHKQLRDLGGVDYADETVHPVTMQFLKDLKANNRRGWLKENDAEFRRAQKDWQAYVESLTQRIVADVDDTVPELPAKDIIFRIYRDIRFSKDPLPYKSHFSAAWSRTGKKGPYACYYVHCEPGANMVGGGIWHPENDDLRLLRASIDERPQRWRRVLAHDAVFRQTFLPAASSAAAKGGEAAALKAFAAHNTEGALKTKPKGFVADHRDIALLKLRNFTVSKKLPDSAFTAADGQDQVVAVLQAMAGFVTHLNKIVRPDPGDDDDSDEE